MAQEIFSVTSSAFPEGTLVVGFRGSEALSRPYAYEIFLVSSAEGDELDLSDTVGSKATLTIRRGDDAPPFVFAGVLSSVELLHELGGRSLLRATLVPQLWLLTLTCHSRLFTKQSIPDILRAVLEDSGFSSDDYSLRLTRSYPPEEHVCQYQESNFDFLSRWMEREGLYYFFEHEEGGERLVITDDLGTHVPLAPSPVRYHPTTGRDVSAGERFQSFTCKQSSLPAVVRLKDYDYANPTLDVSGSAPVSPSGLGEISVHGERFFSPADGKRLAALRAEELRARQTVFAAAGSAFFLRSGYTFELEEHPRPSWNARYLAIEVEHYGCQAIATQDLRRMTGLDSDEVYRASVRAIPASVQFRAERRTPAPRIYGYENGVVDGEAESEYAQIDAQGRYAVKLHFDESDLKNGKASTWVRMLQPHGGGKEGFHFPLRKGTEVLLVFLGGDPDRPVIAGVGPNMHKPSPVTSTNHTKNVIQTGGENRFEIEDFAGKQYVKITTPTEETMLHLGAPHNPTHNIQLQTKGNARFKFGTDWDVTVGGHLDEHVVKEVKETYDSTQTTHVKGAVEEQYDTSQKTTVKGPKTTHATGAVNEQYDSTLSTHVKGEVCEDYDVGQSTTILSGGQTSTITGPQTTILTGNRAETITGTLTQTVSGAMTINCPTSLTVNCPDVTINAAAKHVIVNPASHQEVHAKWNKSAIFAAEEIAFKIAVFGIKLDTGGVALSAVGAKIDNTGYKGDTYMAKNDCGQFKLSQHGVKLRNAGIGLYMYGLVLFS
jgi:type VI secretion system secreted protein VgrG